MRCGLSIWLGFDMTQSTDKRSYCTTVDRIVYLLNRTVLQLLFLFVEYAFASRLRVTVSMGVGDASLNMKKIVYT